MRRLLIVHHSRTGTARAMAEAAARGAAAATDPAELRPLLRDAPTAGPEDLLQAEGYLFAAPENLGSLSGPMKDFFDRCYYPVLGRIEGRPYAALIAAGTDGRGALRQLERIVTGWRLRPVAEPILLRTGADTPEAILAPKHPSGAELARCEELGAAMAAGLALGIF